LENLSFREYLVFVIFPATIPAGPIDTVEHFHANRLKEIRYEDISEGLARVAFGAFQKIVIADYVLANYLFSSGGGLFAAQTGFDSSLSYGLYVYPLILSFLFVYMDFSAYSNLAIGLSRILGYRIPENFNFPVLALSPREFWKRWHMSLSSWCMRNIYFPLLIQTKQFFVPSFMVMLIVGVWHSFTLSWVMWAMHHAAGIYFTGKFVDWFGGWHARNPSFSKLLRPVQASFVIIFVSAGHAFAQFHDPVVAIEMYLKYWLSLTSSVIGLAEVI
jgi:alginate O-acetyltransferase complex protein AlgI